MSRCLGCCQENCGYGLCECYCHGWTITTSTFVLPTAEKCSCKKHRRYQAKRKPTTGCEACWRYYVKVNP